jgi:hypothetical protein
VSETSRNIELFLNQNLFTCFVINLSRMRLPLLGICDPAPAALYDTTTLFAAKTYVFINSASLQLYGTISSSSAPRFARFRVKYKYSCVVIGSQASPFTTIQHIAASCYDKETISYLDNLLEFVLLHEILYLVVQLASRRDAEVMQIGNTAFRPWLACQ